MFLQKKAQELPLEFADRFLKTQKILVNRRLKKIFSSKTSRQKKLLETTRYALFPGGKRLRPLLVLATVKTCLKTVKTKTQIIFKAALEAACALEMVHVYSLIHDDLPCMDNDDLRHGKKTLHKVYPEWLALLTGDFLLTKAFETLSYSSYLKAREKLKLIQILAQYAGGKELLAGQLADLSSEEKKITASQLKKMHLKKTASLITAAIQFGAIIAKISSKEQKILQDFAQKIGLAYQLVDDFLETASSTKTLGKSKKSDLKKQKANAISILGRQKTKNEIDRLFLASVQNLKKLPFSTELLQQLAKKMIRRIF